MAKLIYTATMSLDGHIEDEAGNIDWTAPSPELHAFVNDLLRPIGTYLLGRRMYETMKYWETTDALHDRPAFAYDFAEIWRVADKVVYSKTLESVSSARTRIDHEFDADEVRRMKVTATQDISVGGSELAAQAIGAGLVDELRLFVVPIMLGGGKRCLPGDVRASLELLEERRFDSGTVYLRYSVGRWEAR